MFRRRHFVPAAAAFSLLCLTSCGFHVRINGDEVGKVSKEPPAHLRAADFVIGNPYGLEEIMIAEQGTDTPYLVISDDYDGHCLLMRREVLPERFCFRNGDAIYNTGPAYYPDSTVDRFLHEKFEERFSESVRSALTESNVEVLTHDAVVYGANTEHPEKEKTEMIRRKCFLLSIAEYGRNNGLHKKDGNKIPCLEAYEVQELNWLRSAYFDDDVRVWATSRESYAPEATNAKLYIRPVMTIDGTQEVVAAGEGYRLACDTQSET
ncbi:MAG: hypothetical protein J6Z40_12035 [Oscillospiraceae bacterium]|nr:hypothetical protein [Oscillospiraceae bacterium]